MHTWQLVKCKKTKHVKWFNTVRSNKASPREPLKKQRTFPNNHDEKIASLQGEGGRGVWVDWPADLNVEEAEYCRLMG